LSSYIPKDGAVLSPHVELFRGDDEDGYPFLPEVLKLDAVVSIAMPNCNDQVSDAPVDKPDDPAEYMALLEAKFASMLYAAAESKALVLVVPDVGCGVYMNDPRTVGEAFGRTVINRCPRLFDEIHIVGSEEFAQSAMEGLNIRKASARELTGVTGITPRIQSQEPAKQPARPAQPPAQPPAELVEQPVRPAWPPAEPSAVPPAEKPAEKPAETVEPPVTGIAPQEQSQEQAEQAERPAEPPAEPPVETSGPPAEDIGEDPMKPMASNYDGVWRSATDGRPMAEIKNGEVIWAPAMARGKSNLMMEEDGKVKVQTEGTSIVGTLAGQNGDCLRWQDGDMWEKI